MKSKEKEVLITGLFIIFVLFGDMFGGFVFKWVWIIGVSALFLFFTIVKDDSKPKKFERE